MRDVAKGPFMKRFSPAQLRFTIGVVGLIALSAAATRSAVSASPPTLAALRAGRPTLEGLVLHAAGVYLARVQITEGTVRYYIAEVWRQDPGIGTAPMVGSEYVHGRRREKVPEPVKEGAFIPSQCVIFVSGPSPGTGSSLWLETASVYNGTIPAFKLATDDMRELVKSTQWTAGTVTSQPGS